MKRTFCLILATIIILTFSACLQNSDEDTVVFYYRTVQEDGIMPPSVLSTETRQYTDTRKDYFVLLQRYFNGPLNLDQESPFPAGTTVKRFAINKNRAYITLSDEAATLYGVDLNIACACLTRTIVEMTGAESIELSLESALISNEPYLILRYSDFSVTDGYAAYITE